MAGPPFTEIDQEDFEQLCAMQCTLVEIAAFLKCDDKTVVRWCRRTYGKTFKQVFEQLKPVGRVSLRRAQWQSALGGDRTMLVWLGKNELGQSEQKQITQESLQKFLFELDRRINARVTDEADRARLIEDILAIQIT